MRHLRSFPLIQLSLMALAALAACGDGEEPAGTASGDTLRYEDPVRGLAFDYPSDWRLIQVPGEGFLIPVPGEELLGDGGEARILTTVTVLPPEEVAQKIMSFAFPEMRVQVARLSEPHPVGEFFESLDVELEGQAAASQGAEAVDEQGRDELGGLPARRYVLHFLDFEGATTIRELVVTLRGDLLVILDCLGDRVIFGEIQGDCKAIRDSFEFIESS